MDEDVVEVVVRREMLRGGEGDMMVRWGVVEEREVWKEEG